MTTLLLTLISFASTACEENLDVSVIIPTRNSALTLERCLKSVTRESPKEILAVDIKSTDQTLNILKRYGTRVLVNPSNSLGYSRQLGVEDAKGKLCNVR